MRRCKVKKSKELIKIEKGRSKKVRLRQFPPVSSNMLDGDKKAAMSGVFISHVRVHLNYSGNIDWNGTLEFKDWGNIDMGILGSSQSLTRGVDRDVAKALDNMVMRMYGGLACHAVGDKMMVFSGRLPGLRATYTAWQLSPAVVDYRGDVVCRTIRKYGLNSTVKTWHHTLSISAMY